MVQMSSQITILVILTILSGSNSFFYNVETPQRGQRDPPSISAHRRNFKNVDLVTFTPNSRSQILISPGLTFEDNYYEGETIQFVCKSQDYPVQWSYDGTGTPSARLETQRNSTSDFYNTKAWDYYAILTFSSTDPGNTGRYTCVSLIDPELTTGFYAFFPSDKKLFLQDPNKTHRVQPNPDGTLTIPCTISDPEVRVTLCRSFGGRKCESVQGVYDPEIGMTLNSGPPNSISRVSEYTCIGNLPGSKEERVEFTESYQKSGERIEIQINKGQENVIRCCSRSGSPELRFHECSSLGGCKLLQGGLGESPPEEDLVKTRECSSFQVPPGIDGGSIVCSSADGQIKEDLIFAYDGKSTRTDLLVTPEDSSDILKIYKESFRGKMRLSCIGHPFFFSVGIRWAIVGQGESEQTFINNGFPPRSWIEIDPKENQGKELTCFAPVWNSYDWRKTSIFI